MIITLVNYYYCFVWETMEEFKSLRILKMPLKRSKEIKCR